MLGVATAESNSLRRDTSLVLVTANGEVFRELLDTLRYVMHGLHGVVVGLLQRKLNVLRQFHTTAHTARLVADSHLDSLVLAHAVLVEDANHALIVLDKRVRLVLGQPLLEELMDRGSFLLV